MLFGKTYPFIIPHTRFVCACRSADTLAATYDSDGRHYKGTLGSAFNAFTFLGTFLNLSANSILSLASGAQEQELAVCAAAALTGIVPVLKPPPSPTPSVPEPSPLPPSMPLPPSSPPMTPPPLPSLMLKGVFAVRAGENGKAVHLYATRNIANLSKYWIGVANNGGGTDGPEFPLPYNNASAGDNIIVVRTSLNPLVSFHLCPEQFAVKSVVGSAMSQSGDDAIELFHEEDGNIELIDTFGDADVDGTGQVWEYRSSWAYRTTLVPGGKFNPSHWVYGGEAKHS